MDIAQHCRTLSEFHGGTDLADRVRAALDIQRQQRLALVQAADRIDELVARVHRLELVLADNVELPKELRD